jgi:hypothetical protein
MLVLTSSIRQLFKFSDLNTPTHSLNESMDKDLNLISNTLKYRFLF